MAKRDRTAGFRKVVLLFGENGIVIDPAAEMRTMRVHVDFVGSIGGIRMGAANTIDLRDEGLRHAVAGLTWSA